MFRKNNRTWKYETIFTELERWVDSVVNPGHQVVGRGREQRPPHARLRVPLAVKLPLALPHACRWPDWRHQGVTCFSCRAHLSWEVTTPRHVTPHHATQAEWTRCNQFSLIDGLTVQMCVCVQCWKWWLYFVCDLLFLFSFGFILFSYLSFFSLPLYHFEENSPGLP